VPASADYAYNIILYICNQLQNGQPSPDEYKLIMKSAQASYMAFLLGNFEQYQYGRPIARVSLGQNQRIYEALSPFIKEAPLTIAGNAAAKPADWEATVSMSTVSDDNIRFVTKDSWNSWKKSVIDPVATNPIFTFKGDTIQFAHAGLTSAVMTYVSTPPDTIWAFTPDSDGLPVYDAGNSVGLLWRSVDVMEVIARALRLCGVNLQAGAILQFANELTGKGQ
jgi:hypothetical protein